jgi:hypothetical protein
MRADQPRQRVDVLRVACSSGLEGIVAKEKGPGTWTMVVTRL